MASLSEPYNDVMYAGHVCGWICAERLANKILTGDVHSADEVFTASM